MGTNQDSTPPPGYGINYGYYYGIGELPPPVWSVELTTSEGEKQRLVDAVLSVNIEPEHTALWDASFDLAPVIDPETYRFGQAECYYQGDLKIAIEIESIDTATDGTVTMTGREQAGHSLLGNEFEVEYERIRTHDAIRDFWQDRTGFDATVHGPPVNRVNDITTLVAQTPGTFEDALKANPRDEQGRFLEQEDGSAPNFAPTDPLQITNRGVELRQSNWLGAGEQNSGQAHGVDIVADPDAVDGKAAKLAESGATIEWDIKTGYDIPAFVVVPRWKTVGATGDTIVSIDVDDSTVKTSSAINVADEGAYSWRYPPEFVKDKTLPAGEHTITITKLSEPGDLFVDTVSMNDDRFPYNWDNTLDGHNQLDGPELYPDNYYIRLDKVEPGIDVSDISITTEYSTVTPDTNVSIFTSQAGTLYSEQTQERQTHHFETPGTVPRIVPYIRLSRTGVRVDVTPETGFKSQVLESVKIAVAGDAVSVIHESGQTFTGTKLDILQSLHEQAGYHFQIDHGRTDGQKIVESFRRGDPDMARDLPAEMVVTDVTTSSGTGGYRNRVTVVGADYPPALQRTDDPNQFEFTADDEDEIERVGVRAITIHDDDLETQGAVISRARDELRQRLNEDENGGSIDTTPEIAEPGYPYRVPRILGQMDAVRAPSLGDIPVGVIRYVAAGDTYAVRETTYIRGTLVILDGGKVVVTSSGELRVPGDGSEIRVIDTGSVTVSQNGEIRTVENTQLSPLGDVPAGQTRTVGSGEEFAVTGVSTVAGDLHVEGTGQVAIEGNGGRIIVNGVLEAHTVRDETITCESWSVSESAGSATAAGQFGRQGGLGGRDRADVLGLLTALGD